MSYSAHSALSRFAIICMLLPALRPVPLSSQQQPSAARREPPSTGSALEGGWEGEAQTSRWPLFLTLNVRQGAGRSTLEVLGQSLAVSEIRVQGDSVWVRIGEGERAIVLDARIADATLTGHLKEGKDVLPFSLTRIPTYPKPRDRVEAWTRDLDALATRFLRLDRSFSPGERARFLEVIEETRGKLRELSDNQVIVRMASAIALARNAHTRLYLLRNASELRRLPIRVWWFNDGLYVVRATPEYRRLLGCRIEDIAGTNARHARDIVSAAFAGNPSWVDYKSVYSLTSPEMLNGFDIAPDPESTEIGVSGCAVASGQVTVKPLPLMRKRKTVEAWWDLSPLHQVADEQWVQVLEPRRDGLPLYLRNPNNNYWFEYLPESGILYFQYNRSQDMQSESTSEFGERLLAELDRHPVKGFVLDLRFNTGGNLDLGADLMKKLQERTRGMKRWVITGRATFSAGITHAASWSEAGDVTIVGEPVGDELDFWSEGGNVTLPHSGFNAHFANGPHSYSIAPCPKSMPCYDLSAPSLRQHLPVSASWDDYVKGRDPAMAAILTSVGRGR